MGPPSWPMQDNGPMQDDYDRNGSAYETTNGDGLAKEAVEGTPHPDCIRWSWARLGGDGEKVNGPTREVMEGNEPTHDTTEGHMP